MHADLILVIEQITGSHKNVIYLPFLLNEVHSLTVFCIALCFHIFCIKLFTVLNEWVVGQPS